jgi:hypothetical protein
VRVDGKWHDVPGDAVLDGPNNSDRRWFCFTEPTSPVNKSLINSGQGHRSVAPQARD